MKLRSANPDDIDRLAGIWHTGWQETHAPLLPVELARYRTVENFTKLLTANLPNVTVAENDGVILGLCITKADELFQLYVTAEARGTGVGAQLLHDGEKRIAADGHGVAWLACAIGNDRAARFYQKHGWHLARTFVAQVPAADGTFPLEVWRFEKQVTK